MSGKMTNEQNVALLVKYREAEAARDAGAVRRIEEAIVVGNEGLVRNLASRWARPQSDDDLADAMQAARMGILRALKDWDPALGTFSTHAGNHIRDYVQRWSGKTVAVARPRSAHMPASVARAAQRFRQTYGREPSAADLGITELQLAEWSTSTHFLPFDETDDEKPKLQLTNCTDEGEYEAQCERLQVAWKDAILDLSPRNREIAERVLMKGEQTVKVAADFALTHARIVQVCKRIETRLRRALNPDSYKPNEDYDLLHRMRSREQYAARKRRASEPPSAPHGAAA